MNLEGKRFWITVVSTAFAGAGMIVAAFAPSDTSDAGAPATSLAELVTLAKEIAATDGAPKGLAPLAFGLVRDRLKAMKAATRQTNPSGMSDPNRDNVGQSQSQ